MPRPAPAHRSDGGCGPVEAAQDEHGLSGRPVEDTPWLRQRTASNLPIICGKKSADRTLLRERKGMNYEEYRVERSGVRAR